MCEEDIRSLVLDHLVVRSKCDFNVRGCVFASHDLKPGDRFLSTKHVARRNNEPRDLSDISTIAIAHAMLLRTRRTWNVK